MTGKVLTAVLLGAVSAAAQTTAPGQATTRQATTAPATSAADLCRGVIDPYDSAAERGRFLQAAGVDNELDAKEFEADRAKSDPFVRKFDRWEAILPYDKDANGTIDWFEADAYRLGLREKVLAAHDKNKDGRLIGPERNEASRALARGQVGTSLPASPWSAMPEAIFGAGGRPGAGRTWRDAMQPPQDEQARKEWFARWDTNGDSSISDDERQAMREELRRQWREGQHRRRLEQWDANRDGKLDEQERAAMEKADAERRAQLDQTRREWVRIWDTDGDGQLSEAESAAMTDRIRRRIERARPELDADGDGQISREEVGRYWDNVQKKYDADGDGQLNEAERRRMWTEETAVPSEKNNN